MVKAAVDDQDVVRNVLTAVRPFIGRGKVADYIPDLARVDPHQFGFALATVDGEVHTAGDATTRFSLQSIIKVFGLALVLGRDSDAIWKRVHREPAGTPFNSLVQLEMERGIPRNPFINAGALVITDQLLTDRGDAFDAVRTLLRAESGNPEVQADTVTATSEATTGFRNAAMANLIADFGNLHNPVDRVLDHYFRQCALMLNCDELARAALFLARDGIRQDGSRILPARDAKRINAIMLTCGTYDAAGDFAYRIGLPCKSGVGGGIVAIVPSRYALAAWGPGLDQKGSSVAAAAAIEAFVSLTGCSIF
ncbi:glutaminase [Nonomuraea mesophila]|uniref:Glutaminase n=1 Tax=Nonomuraea mesophila TaxID=2530382 RepID=A0A4R5FUV7_9ACTN|nr:glutaminase [Nonomuraea mesophila]TDE57176.1 glutaminase [Nonomuraea mesophila]